MNDSPSPYPVHAFPTDIRDAILEVIEHMQAPDALIAGSFLTAMSIATQGDIDVELPTGQIRPVSLNILIIADSGERKSATDGLVCNPIKDHDLNMGLEHDAAEISYKASHRLWKAKDAMLQKKVDKAVQTGALNLNEMNHHPIHEELVRHERQEPAKPARERIVHENITDRSLLTAMQGDGKAIALMSDEAEIVLKGTAMSGLGTLNKAWDGAKTLPVDRMDAPPQVYNPRLTVSLMVQKMLFEDYMNRRGERARASGHLARYLVVCPESTVGFRYMTLEERIWQHLPAFHQRVAELLHGTHQRRAAGVYTRQLLSFTAEAKELWVREVNDVEPRLRRGADLDSVRDFASKFMEITSRLAAILHYFDRQQGMAISAETLGRALDIVGWHFDEYIDLFGEATEPEGVKDARRIVRHLWSRYWMKGLDRAVRNDVRQSGPIRHQGRFEVALHHLCEDRVIQVEHEDPIRRKGRLWIYLNGDEFKNFRYRRD